MWQSRAKSTYAATLLWLLVASNVWIACGDSDDSNNDNPDAGQSNTVVTSPEGLRLFHALSTPEAIDVTLIDNATNDTITIEGVTRNVATDYSAVPPGEYRAIFLEAGTQNPLGNGFSVSNINIASGEASTLVVSEDASGAPVGQVIPDDLTAPGENGARYRFVYRASGPRGDLYDTSTGALIQQGLSLGQLTLYSDIDGGTYTFEVRPEGLTQVMHTIDQVDLKPGVVYTIFVLGNGDPNMDDNVVDSNVSHVLVMDWDFN